jgi:hypothetical protein
MFLACNYSRIRLWLVPNESSLSGSGWDEPKNSKDDVLLGERIDQATTSCVVDVVSQVGAMNVDVQ